MTAAFPPKVTYVDVPDPNSPPPGATEVTAEFLNDLQDYLLGLPSADDVAATVLSMIQGTLVGLFYDGSLYPVRPDTTESGQHMLWTGPQSHPPTSGGTTGGGTRAYAPFDFVALNAS